MRKGMLNMFKVHTITLASAGIILYCHPHYDLGFHYRNTTRKRLHVHKGINIEMKASHAAGGAGSERKASPLNHHPLCFPPILTARHNVIVLCSLGDMGQLTCWCSLWNRSIMQLKAIDKRERT